METFPNLLGWVEPSLKFGTNIVKLVKCIGMGRTSVVYEGTFNEESVAVKMAKKVEYFSCLECERNALQELSDLIFQKLFFTMRILL
ncbi:unnamed protein product [Rhizophagus irregularis]|nr:unnamed protein product [Rhizophagus irregularis]